MNSTQYFIVGGGMAGGSAIEAIRERDPEGRIILASDEQHFPYDRVPLSKEYLLGKLPRESLFLQDEHFYKEQNVELLLDRRVQRLNLDARTVVLSDAQEIKYERLLLAMGGRPRCLPIPGNDLPGIYYLRTIDDSEALQSAMSRARRAVVVGGGFIGCEIAAACAQKGLDTTIIEGCTSLLNAALDPETAGWITRHFSEHGVHVLTNEEASRFIETDGRASGVETKTGKSILGDFVVVGIGIAPNIELAREAGLTVDNGIIVNERLEAGSSAVYAGGDVARFYSPVFEKHLRVEHYDVAVKHGQVAGANMAGGSEGFNALPYFYSQLFRIRIELWGDPAQRDLVVRRGPLEFTGEGGFSQFYLSNGRIQGYLSVNRPFHEAETAQRLILSRRTIENTSILSNQSLDLSSLLKES